MGFKSFDVNKIKEILNIQNKENKKRYNWASLPEKGESFKIRILPPVGNMTFPFVKLIKHYQVPNEDGQGITHINCLKTWDIDCPVCEKLRELERKFGEDLVRKHFATMRGLFNVLIKESNKYKENVPYIISFPKTALVWFISIIGDEEVGNITDPKTGFWVRVTRKENNQLDFQIIPKPSPIAQTDEEIERIANECIDLTTLLKQPDDEYYQKLVKIAKNLEMQVKQKVGLLDETNSDAKKVEIVSSVNEAVEKSIGSINIANQNDKNNVIIPDDAPECFGNFNEGSSRCMICIHELECRQASGR